MVRVDVWVVLTLTLTITLTVYTSLLPVEFYESHTHTVDMFIRASEQQRQAYGYTAEFKCVTITANVRILHLSPFTMNSRARGYYLRLRDKR